MAFRPLRVLIADHQVLLRRGLATMLGARADFIIAGEASDGRAALELIASGSPDVAVLNLQLPVMDGLSVARRAREHFPRTEIVFLASTYAEQQVREAFEAGCRGFLLIDCEFEELALAIKKAACGDYYVSGPASHDMVAEYVKPLLEAQKPGGLMTQRERELARLLADGYSTKEAADVLNISVKTAETHRASIMKKLNAKNVTDIVKYCIRNHIIEP